MKKKYGGILLCILLVSTIPVFAGTAMAAEITEEPENEPESLLGVTFVIGYVLNPEISEYNILSAKAVALFYYDRGLIFKDAGIATGLKDVRFRIGPLVTISEPGSFGVAKVFGVCTGFHVSK